MSLGQYFISLSLIFLSISPLLAPAAWATPEAEGPSNIFIEQKDSGTIVIWKDVTLPEQKHYNSVVVMNGHLDFFGTAKHLVLVNGRITLHPGSKVEERLVVLNGRIEQLDGSQTPPPTPPTFSDRWQEKWNNLKDKFSNFSWSHDSQSHDSETPSSEFWKILWWPFSFALFLAVSLVLLAVFYFLSAIFLWITPRLSQNADEYFRSNPLKSLGIGIVAFLLFTPILVLLIVSIVGILLIPFYVLFVCLLGLAGIFTSARALGLVVFERLGIHSRFWASLAGFFILWVVLFLPFFSSPLLMGIWLMGLGATIKSTLINRFQYRTISYNPSSF